MPTTESSSPTATSAVNEKRRPPLTTLATRLISITRSWRSSPWGLTVSMSAFSRKLDDGSGSQLQPALAGTLGERPDAAVVAIAAAIEDARLDARLLRPLGEDLPSALGLLDRLERAQLGLGPGHRRDGPGGLIVDELGEDSLVRPKHRQPGAPG